MPVWLNMRKVLCDNIDGNSKWKICEFGGESYSEILTFTKIREIALENDINAPKDSSIE